MAVKDALNCNTYFQNVANTVTIFQLLNFKDMMEVF